jgi:hypothetical protein
MGMIVHSVRRSISILEWPYRDNGELTLEFTCGYRGPRGPIDGSDGQRVGES